MEQTFQDIKSALSGRILILDGAMGTRIQAMGLAAEQFHGQRFRGWPVSLAGNNDVLCLTAPHIVRQIHRLYIDAGADIIATNTFSSNPISQQEYGLSDYAAEMARQGAILAREEAGRRAHPGSTLKGENTELTGTDSRPTSNQKDNHLPTTRKGEPEEAPRPLRKIYVAGSMGPTSKSLTLASDMSQPAKRIVSFDEMVDAYRLQAEALIEGGVDFLLLETCYDALNTKAALAAISDINRRFHREIPVAVSVTVNDRSGRTLTGQTLYSFYTSISHYPYLLSFGLNCSFGVTDLRPFMEQLSANIPLPLSIYPNAGLPNEMGQYEELPDFTASHLHSMAADGLLNIAGGCCGTDENHIRAIAQALRNVRPRTIPQADNKLRVSGLEPLLIDRKTQNFTNIGERTNVAGSRRFARLIAQKHYEEALSVAREQIEGGATIIDVNMDDAMLDSRQEMEVFLRYLSGEPAVARVPIMIDSSDWPTVLAGLKNTQGKCIVNSISLKEGEHAFLAKAAELRRLGAAVVVMAFDEEGQATTFQRKITIVQRAYNLLTGVGFPPEDIIFDVNILALATGIKEHQAYALDFIRAVRWIKENLPQAKTSGGVSNLSFAFRGNNKVREAMHSAFLYHAIRAGLDMAIVNPSMLQVYDDIPHTLLRAVEDVILNTDDQATERLITLASSLKEAAATPQGAEESHPCGSPLPPVEQRLSLALTTGDSSHLAVDIPEALAKYGEAIKVIEGPLMSAMEHIGSLFGEGKMFLPQVVKSAQVMKDAVALLTAQDSATNSGEIEENRPAIVLATANGDVHDIGKNIVKIVLACNGFRVFDLGVMVPCEAILAAAKEHKPVLVGISGLITPSLKEMEKLCEAFQKEHLSVPVLVGGATTSALHTAVRLAPLYDGLVVYGGDASRTSVLAKQITAKSGDFTAVLKAEQRQIRDAWNEHHAPITPYFSDELRIKSEAFRKHLKARLHDFIGSQTTEFYFNNSASSRFRLPSSIENYVDWRMYLLFWGFKGETLPQLLVNPEAEQTLRRGKERLAELLGEGLVDVDILYKEEGAIGQGNDIIFCSDGQRLPMLRSQSAAGHYCCLADFFDEEQACPIGIFLTCARPKYVSPTEEDRLTTHALCARLAEAAAVWLEEEVKRLKGEKGKKEEGLREDVSTFQRFNSSTLRVAFGYAACPDHSLKRIAFDRLEAEQKLDVALTDHYSIVPSTSVCGLLVCHPEARYFPVGRIDSDQLRDYCRRRGITEEEGQSLLSKMID